ILTLSAAPRSAIPFLNDHLRPVDADPKVEQFIADLDSEDYQVRTAATKQLRNLGDLAEPALRRTLAGNPSAEARRRVEQLLEKLKELTPPPEILRAMRAIEVLEYVNTPEARQLLKKLAQGTTDARLTR